MMLQAMMNLRTGRPLIQISADQRYHPILNLHPNFPENEIAIALYARESRNVFLPKSIFMFIIYPSFWPYWP